MDTAGPLLPSRQVLQKNTAKYSAIQETLASLWKLHVHKATRNPSPNPVSLELRHIDTLRNNVYYVAHKTDGVRYLLLLGRFTGTAARGRQQAEYAVMIDRAMRVFEVRARADSHYFEGSLFDGELVWEYETDLRLPRQIYYVFDTIAHKGRSVAQSPYAERLKLVHASFSGVPDVDHQLQIVCPGNKDALCFLAKPVYNLLDLQMCLDSPVYHATDGLVFTPHDQPVGSGRVETLFKWKPRHTLDFKLKYVGGRADSRAILYTDGGQLHRADDVDGCGVTYKGKQIVFVLQDSPQFDEYIAQPLQQAEAQGGDLEVVVECECHFDSKVRNQAVLTLVRIRTDKLEPNDRVTIERTLINLKEDITLEFLQGSLTAV